MKLERKRHRSNNNEDKRIQMLMSHLESVDGYPAQDVKKFKRQNNEESAESGTQDKQVKPEKDEVSGSGIEKNCSKVKMLHDIKSPRIRLDGKVKSHGNGAGSPDIKKTDQKFHNISNDDFKQFKLKMKELKIKRKKWPRLFLNDTGRQASLQVKEEERVPIFMRDIQILIIYGLNGVLSQYKPRFCKILNWAHVSHVVTVLVNGLAIDDIMNINSECFPDDSDSTLEDVVKTFFPQSSSSMNEHLELRAPSSYDVDPVNELMQVYLSRTAVNRIKRAHKSTEDTVIDVHSQYLFSINEDLPGTVDDLRRKLTERKPDNFDRRKLLLNVDCLIREKYPMPIPGCLGFNDTEFAMTKAEYSPVTPASPMFGVDCEMCLTTIGKNELTSVSVVDENHKLVYHSLVKPHNHIINYLTRYSGITEEMMTGVTTTLEDVHREFRRFLPPDAILVGHSLNSDLQALKLFHPYCIDSSVIYNLSGLRYMKTSLKRLTNFVLGEEIQTGFGGHDPTEDACASLKLVQEKLKKDVAFADVINGGDDPSLEPLVSNTVSKENDNNINITDYLVTRHFCNLFEFIREGSVSSSLQKSLQKKVRCSFATTSLGRKAFNSVPDKILQGLCGFSVLPGNKHLSVAAVNMVKNVDFTLVNFQMDVRMASRSTKEKAHQLAKLDHRIHRIVKNAPGKSLVIVAFSGSPLCSTGQTCSNGVAFLHMKGESS